MLAVPSTKRAAHIEQYGEQAGDSLQDEGDGWFATPHNFRSAESVEEIPSSGKEAGRHSGSVAAVESDDDIPDIDDLVLEDADEEVRWNTASCFKSNNPIESNPQDH